VRDAVYYIYLASRLDCWTELIGLLFLYRMCVGDSGLVCRVKELGSDVGDGRGT
jgi:hypothetical protein